MTFKVKVVKYYYLTPKAVETLRAFREQLKRDFPEGWWQNYQKELKELKEKESKREGVGEDG